MRGWQGECCNAAVVVVGSVHALLLWPPLHVCFLLSFMQLYHTFGGLVSTPPVVTVSWHRPAFKGLGKGGRGALQLAGLLTFRSLGVGLAVLW